MRFPGRHSALWYLPVPLTLIGTPELPVVNTFDHKLERVIAALPDAEPAAA